MAISMSGATVDTSERDSLLSSSIDSSVVSGGATANTSGGFFGLGAEASGAALAGVTDAFASHVSSAIESYKSKVQSELDKLQDIESNTAFQGTAVKSALTKFVTSVRDVGKQYLEILSAAETQIINSVAQAYQTQDADLSGNLNADAGGISINR